MNADKKTKRSRVDVSMFGESTDIADVKLVVEGTSIPVVKAVLSISSPVFMAMFQQGFKEKNQKEIPLPGKKLDDMLTLLNCIYPDILLPITESIAFTVLPLSNEYQMMSLKTRCEDALLQALDKKFEDFYLKDFAYLFKFLSVSVEFSLHSLKQYCVSLAADFKQKERKESMLELSIPADVVKQIDDLVIARQEISLNDAKAMMVESSKYYSVVEIINKFCKTPEDMDTRRAINRELRGLRLAYSYATSNQRKLAISIIQREKESEYWCHDAKYKLLPENIKRDIERAPTQNDD